MRCVPDALEEKFHHLLLLWTVAHSLGVRNLQSNPMQLPAYTSLLLLYTSQYGGRGRGKIVVLSEEIGRSLWLGTYVLADRTDNMALQFAKIISKLENPVSFKVLVALFYIHTWLGLESHARILGSID